MIVDHVTAIPKEVASVRIVNAVSALKRNTATIKYALKTKVIRMKTRTAVVQTAVIRNVVTVPIASVVIVPRNRIVEISCVTAIKMQRSRKTNVAAAANVAISAMDQIVNVANVPQRNIATMLVALLTMVKSINRQLRRKTRIVVDVVNATQKIAMAKNASVVNAHLRNIVMIRLVHTTNKCRLINA